MKTWICAPMTNFFVPSLGSARLYAYVKKHGYDVRFQELNQNTYFDLLSREYLEPVLERVQWSADSASRNRFMREDLGSILIHSSGNAMQQLLAKGMLLDKSWYKYVKNMDVVNRPLFSFVDAKITPDKVLYALLSEKDFVLKEIDRSRKILDEGYFSLEPDVFIANYYTLLCGKAIIDAAYYPTQIDLGLGFYGTAFGITAGDIVRSVTDERYNFLIPYYRKKIVPQVKAEQPGVVGISITCLSELVPAFTLAHTIKSVDPGIHIVLGGGLVTEIAYRMAKNPPLWEMFDSLIEGPGEVPFTELIERLEKKADLSGVPNIIYKKNGNIIKGEISHEFDINEACTPEFAAARPKGPLPLETSSACYWGRCVFCYYPQQGTPSYDSKSQKTRTRRIELVLSDMKELKEKYDPVCIGFTDSSLSPKRIEDIADENIRTKNQMKFSALFRMEKTFKSLQFCEKIVAGGFIGGHVGLESGSQKVNDIINKGINLKDVELILKNFHETGILVHIFSIVGMPGETDEDALETFNFFKRLHKWLELGFVVYPLYVLEHSPLAYRAPEFKLKLTALPDEYLAQSMDYRVEGGTSAEKSMATSISYSEQLSRYLHPLNRIIDIESLTMFLIAQKAKGIPPEKVRDTGFKI
jgi:radical SAM superfamily enzyme YgiQ (UPF0313 family)